MTNIKQVENLEDLTAMCGCDDYTQNGKCSNCGNCCSNTIPISKREFLSISKFILDNNITMREINLPLVNLRDMTCPFRDDINKKCKIYPVRPFICREYICSKNSKYSKSFFKKIQKEHRANVNMRELFKEVYRSMRR
jgi:Fe-S-cluster containining protein